MRKVLPVAALTAALSGPASALELATWNIGWLTSRAAEINKGIADENRRIHQRTEADFARLRAYAEELDADLIALQEIDSIEAARKLFPPQEYGLILTDEPDYQRPGLAIRKGLRYTRNPDLEELDLLPDRERSLRRGADITVHLPGGDLRLLTIHLKSGCFSPASSNKACGQIEAQIPMVSRWMDARQQEGLALAVMGDVNRRIPEGDPLWAVLDDGPAPLVRVTAGRSSTCCGRAVPRVHRPHHPGRSRPGCDTAELVRNHRLSGERQAGQGAALGPLPCADPPPNRPVESNRPGCGRREDSARPVGGGSRGRPRISSRRKRTIPTPSRCWPDFASGSGAQGCRGCAPAAFPSGLRQKRTGVLEL